MRDKLTDNPDSAHRSPIHSNAHTEPEALAWRRPLPFLLPAGQGMGAPGGPPPPPPQQQQEEWGVEISAAKEEEHSSLLIGACSASTSSSAPLVAAPSLPRTLTAVQQQQSMNGDSSTPAGPLTWKEQLWTGTKRFTAGAVGGVFETAVGHPLDLLKVRMQTIAATATTTAGGSAGANAAAAAAAAAAAGGGQASALRLLASTVRNEGFLALYRGASSRVVGSAIGNSVLFGTNGEFKRLLGADPAQPLSGRFLLAAGFTGLAEALVFTPIDLVKTRCQVQYGRDVALTPWTVAKQLVREHGVVRVRWLVGWEGWTDDSLGWDRLCSMESVSL